MFVTLTNERQLDDQLAEAIRAAETAPYNTTPSTNPNSSTSTAKPARSAADTNPLD